MGPPRGVAHVRTARPRLRPPRHRHHPAEFRRGLAALCPELRGRALSLAKDATLADNLVQDVVERALKFEDQYRSGTNLRPRPTKSSSACSSLATGTGARREEKKALGQLACNLDAWPHNEAFPTPEREAELAGATASSARCLQLPVRSSSASISGTRPTARRRWSSASRSARSSSRLHRARRQLADAMLCSRTVLSVHAA